jgi:hypothetical protein
MNTVPSKPTNQSWLSVAGAEAPQLAESLAVAVRGWVDSGSMPVGEPARVASVATGIAKGAFSTSRERLELLRELCHIYSAGIQSEKITSHRPVIGPVIVAAKKMLFRVIASLLGPTFRFQRDFNARVIRLLGDLCNEDTMRGR